MIWFALCISWISWGECNNYSTRIDCISHAIRIYYDQVSGTHHDLLVLIVFIWEDPEVLDFSYSLSSEIVSKEGFLKVRDKIRFPLNIDDPEILSYTEPRPNINSDNQQIIRLASNIAEGAERDSIPEFIRFLHIAKGSAAELRTQIYIAYKIDVISKKEKDGLIEEIKSISSMLQGLIKHQKNKLPSP